MAGNDQRLPHFMVTLNLPMLFDSEVRRNNYVQSLLLVRNLGFANWIRCTLFKHIRAMCVQPDGLEEICQEKGDY